MAGIWYSNTAWNGSYGPSGGNLGQVATYADANPAFAYPGQVMTGLALYFAGNRIFPQIQAGLPAQTGAWQPQAIFNPVDPNYFPDNGCSGIGDDGGCTLYVDTTLVFLPAGEVAIGAALRLVIGNRLGVALLGADASDPTTPTSWAYNDTDNGNYFNAGSNLGDNYVDTNPVTVGEGNVVTGIALYLKGNRIAPQLYGIPWSGIGS